MKFSLIERTFAVVVGLTVGIVISMSSIGIVNAARVLVSKSCISASACATYTNKGSGPGIQGNNNSVGGPNEFGVLGTSSGTDGVHGISTHAGSSGIAGIQTGTGSTSGNGAYAQSDGSGAGVYATSAQGNGVSAFTNSVADGVYGYSKSGHGVLAESDGSTAGDYTLAAMGDGTVTDLFAAVNSATGDACYINSDSDLSCNGSITGNALRIRQPTGSGHVLAYTPESATATIDDVGTARMYGGVANVQISPDFAATIEPGSQYYVFLTPLGDTRGLYVSFKGSRGFQVRETERGRSSLAFDYRIVGHPLAAGNGRLLPAPPMHRPKLPQPRP